jgi:hypothetical protein
MKKLILAVLAFVTLTHASTPEDLNVLVMDTESGGLWHAFESNKACLGLHPVKMFDKSEHNTFRWALSVTGNERGKFEVLLIETPTHHNVFFGANITKGVGRACKSIKKEVKSGA